MAIEIGSIIEGTVVKVADYGAIVRLAGGNMGLVHISEVADAYVRDVSEHFKESDRIVVKVLRLNNKGRYELSMKQADQSGLQKFPQRDQVKDHGQTNKEENFVPRQKVVATFEERLSLFKKDSEERLGDIKRGIENKRGGGRK